MQEGKPAWHDTWANVDQTEDPHWFVRFIDSNREYILQAIRQNPRQVLSYLEPAPGKVMLDIGSGTGVLLHDLAKLVMPGGKIIGVDYSKTMVEEARKRVFGMGLPLEFAEMDAQKLLFADDTFHTTCSTIVFEHLPDPMQALREAVRVTKPGGVVAIIEQDLLGCHLDIADPEVTQLVSGIFAQSVRHGSMGSRLYRMFIEAGLRDIRVLPVSQPMLGNATAVSFPVYEEASRRAEAQGLITADQAQEFRNEFRRRIQDNTAFAFVPVFRATGRKPR